MATEVGALPDDALAAVFRALPPRSLAVVRCVCKPWRDVVDARALLLGHLHRLPLTVRGVFINYPDHDHPHHLARPCSRSAKIQKADGTLSFLPHHCRKLSILDHCNGLLLCGKAGLNELCVCNPATRRWMVLPRWWRVVDDYERHHRYAGAYIAFDPAESPHYQVVLVPALPKDPLPLELEYHYPRKVDDRWTAAEVQRRTLLLEKEKDAPFCLDWFFSLPEDGTAVGQLEFGQGQHDVNDYLDWRGYMEWPPAAWTMRVFSSSTGRWEDRAFGREGLPAGTVVKMMRSDPEPLSSRRPPWRYAVYHHGSLYVHCRGSFVARLSLSKNTYQIIETPAKVHENMQPYLVKYIKPYLGKLQNSVCFGIVHYDQQLQIWILDESCGQMEWALKYETLVGYIGRQQNGSWTIDENIENKDTDHDVESPTEGKNSKIQDTKQSDVESLSEEGHEWDSDDDDTFTINTESQKYFHNDEDKHIYIIGFHPYKEVVFMVRDFHVVAYHLNSNKIQYLGNSCPKYCHHDIFWNPFYESFLYTPCMIGDLLHGDQCGGQSSSED